METTSGKLFGADARVFLCAEVFTSAGNLLQARLTLNRTPRNMFPLHRRRGSHPASDTVLPCTGNVNEPNAAQKTGRIARRGPTACSSFGQLEARRPRCGGRAGPGSRQFRASRTLTEPMHHSNSSECAETRRNGGVRLSSRGCVAQTRPPGGAPRPRSARDMFYHQTPHQRTYAAMDTATLRARKMRFFVRAGSSLPFVWCTSVCSPTDGVWGDACRSDVTEWHVIPRYVATRAFRARQGYKGGLQEGHILHPPLLASLLFPSFLRTVLPLAFHPRLRAALHLSLASSFIYSLVDGTPLNTAPDALHCVLHTARRSSFHTNVY